MKRQAYQVSVMTIVINIILSIIKLMSGLVSHSKAMISDAIHSLSDVVTTIMVMVGILISSYKSDKEHPYGHERIECIVSIVLALILGWVGLKIGCCGLIDIIEGKQAVIISNWLVLLVAALSIITKEWMYWYTKQTAKKIKSTSMMADAWHHRSDAMSSIGSLIGAIGVMLGFPFLDAIASIIICLFILKTAIDIFKDAASRVVDRACNDDILTTVEGLIYEKQEVLSIDDIKSRIFASFIYMDIEIGLNANMSLEESHYIAHEISNKIETEIKEIKHCMIHINPIRIDK